jgi:hypothetical protein
LASVINTHRQKKKKDRLSPEHIAILEAIPHFDWGLDKPKPEKSDSEEKATEE